ncbi:MAG: hypothetical protein E6G93_16020 [Alphaproteobacteria bacterium]|nr:MAG: hypothetical protein E6G93_16020 [Alphaproteobacteria bacterium]
MQLIEQRLDLFQIECVEAFGEPAEDRSEQIVGLLFLSPVAPKPRSPTTSRRSGMRARSATLRL